MELRADATILFPRDVVYQAYRDDLVGLVEHMPNIRQIEEKEREPQSDAITKIVNVWHGGGDLPAAARVVLTQEMLSWTDYARWLDSEWACEWRIETHSFSDAVSCGGKNRFVATDGGTRLEIRGDLNIDASKIKGVPKLLQGSVGKTLEEFLVTRITPNLLEVSSGLQRYLENSRAS